MLTLVDQLIFCVALLSLFVLNILTLHGVRSGPVNMATYRLPPPEPFNFKQPAEWPRWKRRFEQFREASGLSGENDTKQVNTPLYSMGEDAEDTLLSMDPTDEERVTYDGVIAKFDGFFKVRKNTIYDRTRFNRRVQEEGESIEQFITSLYGLVDLCEFDRLRDQMIRDHIVVGIRDKALSEQLQTDPDLTIDKAKRLTRQREAVHDQAGHMNGNGAEKRVDKVSSKHAAQKKKQGASRQPLGSSSSGNKCSRCGKRPHSKQDCPARSITCYSCKKVGHFSSQCFSKHKKRVSDIKAKAQSEELGTNEDIKYLNVITLGPNQSSLNTTLSVNGKDVSFKLDTGAEVTVVSEAILPLRGASLKNTPIQLFGPAGKSLEVLGQASVKLSYDSRSATQSIFVVKGVSTNLLGLPAIRALQLLTITDEVESSIPDKYPKLFAGLGTFQGEYEIKLKVDAQPVAIYTARNVPHMRLDLRAGFSENS